MKRTFLILEILTLLLVVSCVKPKKGPDVDIDDDEQTETPSIKEPVVFQTAFDEGFSQKTSEIFDFRYKEDKDFRYYSGYPSLSEQSTTILMLRLDPADNAGVNRGSSISNKEPLLYGSYSARLRVPNILKAQPNLGACAVLSLSGIDETNNISQIDFEIKLAAPTDVFLRTISGKANNSVKDEERLTPPSFNAATKFMTIGFDYYPEKIEWWYINASTQKRVVIKEAISLDAIPSNLTFNFYHSKLEPANASATQAPYYPFELEIDWIRYEPFEDNNNEWNEK